MTRRTGRASGIQTRLSTVPLSATTRQQDVTLPSNRHQFEMAKPCASSLRGKRSPEFGTA